MGRDQRCGCEGDDDVDEHGAVGIHLRRVPQDRDGRHPTSKQGERDRHELHLPIGEEELFGSFDALPGMVEPDDGGDDEYERENDVVDCRQECHHYTMSSSDDHKVLS